MTFAELKAELDKLSPEQLAADVIWWGNDRGGIINCVLVLEEDFISVGEGMEPASAYDDPEYPLDPDDITATMKSGTPVLCTDEPDEEPTQ